MSTPARLFTAAIAGLAAFAAVDIYTILTGPVRGIPETISVVLLFTVTHVQGFSAHDGCWSSSGPASSKGCLRRPGEPGTEIAAISAGGHARCTHRAVRSQLRCIAE